MVGEQAMGEIVFRQDLMTAPGFEKEFKGVPLHMDNISELRIVRHQTYSSRAQHVALKRFFLCGLIKEGNHIHTDEESAHGSGNQVSQQAAAPVPDRAHQELPGVTRRPQHQTHHQH